jgi:hypothetical protein
VVHTSGVRSQLWLTSGIAAVLVGLSIGTTGQAAADQPKPTPSPANTSSTDEIADMVMDAIEQDDGTAPTASGVPAPSG